MAGNIIQPDNVDFSNATRVRVLTNRFVIPVPASPDGGNLAFEPDTGMAILDKAGKQKRGFVFRNHADHAWQVAKQDGSGVILVNEVPETDSARILELRAELAARLGDTPEALNALVAEIAAMGHGDQFNSSMSGVSETLRTAPGRHYEVDGAGLYVREGKPVEAVRIVGTGRFQGPVIHAFEGDAVLVRHAPDKVNLCQSDVFERTYLMEDGSPARVADLVVGYVNSPVTLPVERLRTLADRIRARIGTRTDEESIKADGEAVVADWAVNNPGMMRRLGLDTAAYREQQHSYESEMAASMSPESVARRQEQEAEMLGLSLGDYDDLKKKVASVLNENYMSAKKELEEKGWLPGPR